MKKSVRVVLYLLSLFTLLAMFLLIAFSKNRGQSANVMQQEESSMTLTEEAQENIAQDMQTSTQENETQDMQSGTQENEVQDMQTSTQENETQDMQSGTQEDTMQGEKTQTSTTLFFAGDVLVSSRIQNYYNADGIERIVSKPLLQEMLDADVCMLNNEFPFSSRGTPMEEKQFTFQCEPKYVSVLQELGVDVVSLANNHTLDYGRDALSDTFVTLDNAGILYAGAGETRERAEEVQIVEVNGKKFGFIAASRVIPVTSWDVRNQTPGLFTAYDDTRLVEVVAEAEKTCDFVTVFLHWGVEYDAYPQEYQRTIAGNCFQAGADLVIGAHTHCLQGIEYIDGKPVYYSLGNYIFGDSVDKSAAVKVTIAEDNTVTYELLPVCTTAGTTQLMEEAAAKQLYQYMSDISVNAAIDENGIISIKE